MPGSGAIPTGTCHCEPASAWPREAARTARAAMVCHAASAARNDEALVTGQPPVTAWHRLPAPSPEAGKAACLRYRQLPWPCQPSELPAVGIKRLLRHSGPACQREQEDDEQDAANQAAGRERSRARHRGLAIGPVFPGPEWSGACQRDVAGVIGRGRLHIRAGGGSVLGIIEGGPDQADGCAPTRGWVPAAPVRLPPPAATCPPRSGRGQQRSRDGAAAYFAQKLRTMKQVLHCRATYTAALARIPIFKSRREYFTSI